MKKPSEIFESENSSLRKTFNKAQLAEMKQEAMMDEAIASVALAENLDKDA